MIHLSLHGPSNNGSQEMYSRNIHHLNPAAALSVQTCLQCTCRNCRVLRTCFCECKTGLIRRRSGNNRQAFVIQCALDRIWALYVRTNTRQGASTARRGFDDDARTQYRPCVLACPSEAFKFALDKIIDTRCPRENKICSCVPDMLFSM